MQYMPTTVIPMSTISTRCPPAIRDSNEMENNEDEKTGARPLVPEETICAKPFTEPRALRGAFITTSKCIASVKRNSRKPYINRRNYSLKAVIITDETNSCKIRIAQTRGVTPPARAATSRRTHKSTKCARKKVYVTMTVFLGPNFFSIGVKTIQFQTPLANMKIPKIRPTW